MSKKAFWVLTENSSKCLVNLWIVNKVEEGILTENSSKRLEVFFCKDKQRQSWRRRFDRKLTTYLTILNDGDFSWYEEIEMGCGLARLRHSTKLFLSHVFLLSSDLSTPLTFVKPFSFFCTARNASANFKNTSSCDAQWIEIESTWYTIHKIS